MRILLVAAQPFYTQRGTPIAVRLLATEMARAGHEVDLLTYWEGQEIEIPGVSIFRSVRVPGVRGIPIGFSIKKLIADVSLFLSFMRLALRTKYDVVHAVEESVYFALAARWLHRAKVVYDMDSSLADQMSEHFRSAKALHPLFRRVEAWAVRRADRVIAVCEDVAVIGRRMNSPERVFVLNDIEPPEASSEPAQDLLRDFTRPDDLIALYVGNLEPYQGVDLLVDAASMLPDDVRLHILIIGGSGDRLATMKRQIASRSLNHRISFLGPRPLTQLMAYLAQADILLSPRSYGNNTPLKLYCYMSAGKPIVATNIASHTQLLTSQLAVLVEPSPGAIAGGMELLARDPSLRDALGQRVRSEVQKKYTLEAFRVTLECSYSGLA